MASRSSNGKGYVYKAFISYSHAADNKLAPAIQSGLQKFAKPFYRLRALRVFHDKTGLNLTPQLWPLIQKRLSQSEYFLLLASPDAAQSEWVQAEVDEWLKLKNDSLDKFLIVLTNGEIEWSSQFNDFDWDKTTAMPLTLRAKFKKEPLYSDLRWATRATNLTLKNPKFLNHIAIVAATLHGKTPDAMIGDDVSQHRTFKLVSTAVIGLLLALATISSLTAYYARKRGKEAATQSYIAAQREEENNRLVYDTSISSVEREIREGHFPLAVEKLEAISKPAFEHLRGFEWYRLWRMLHGEKAILWNQTVAITALAFSPDGKTLATADYDSVVKLWDFASRNVLATLESADKDSNDSLALQVLTGHIAIRSLAFSPDGKVLATGGRSLNLWDVDTHHEFASMRSETAINSVSFSPDGETVATGDNAGTMKTWDVADLKSVAAHTPSATSRYSDSISSIAFSPDGKILVIASGNTVVLWDTGKRQRSTTLPSGDEVTSVAFAPDGRSLAIGANGVALWDIGTHKRLDRLTSIQQALSLSFSPDGRMLAIGGPRGLKVWEVAEQREFATFAGHSVSSVAFSPDGKTLATGGLEGTVKLWDTAANNGWGFFKIARPDAVAPMAISPDGLRLAAAVSPNEGTVRIWDTFSYQSRSILTGHRGLVTSIVFSPDEQTLATGSGDSTVRLWQAASGKELAILSNESDVAFSLAFSPDGRILATGGWNAVTLWDVASRSKLARLKGHEESIISISFSPDGRTLATGSEDKTVRLWDTVTRNQTALLSQHEEAIFAIAFSPDGKVMATGSGDHSIRLWDTVTHSELAVLKGHQDVVNALAFSPDSKTLASSSWDEVLKLWDTTTRRGLLTLAAGDIRAIGFSPQGKILNMAGWEASTQLFAATEDEVAARHK